MKKNTDKYFSNKLCIIKVEGDKFLVVLIADAGHNVLVVMISAFLVSGKTKLYII